MERRAFPACNARFESEDASRKSADDGAPLRFPQFAGLELSTRISFRAMSVIFSKTYRFTNQAPGTTGTAEARFAPQLSLLRNGD